MGGGGGDGGGSIPDNRGMGRGGENNSDQTGFGWGIPSNKRIAIFTELNKSYYPIMKVNFQSLTYPYHFLCNSFEYST